jgi:hypothetical protein
VKFAWPNVLAHLSFGSASIIGGISEDGTMQPARGPLKDATDGFDDKGGVVYARAGGVPTGVATMDVASATVGDCRGEDAGRLALRQLTRSGGSRGVVAYRSASTCSGSITIAFAFSTSIAIGVGALSSSSSLLAKAGVGTGVKLSVRSTADGWWMELWIDDERVDGTREGVALLDTLLRVELRSRTLREKDGNRLSNFPAMLYADASRDRRRLASRNSVSWLVKYSFSGS